MKPSGTMVAACAALLLVASAGCSSTLPARVQLKSKRLLVIPFAEGAQKEFDSALGRDLATGITVVVSRNLPSRAAVLDFRDAEHLLLVPRPAAMDWAKLGAVLKADYLLLGTVKDYRLRDKGNLTTRRGTMVVDYRVLDVARGTVLLTEADKKFVFPPESSRDPEFAVGADSFTPPEEIARGLLATAADGIADEFYDREAPE